MLTLLDSAVSNVVDALHAAGLWDNTLLVWSSDNGAAIELSTGAKSSWPLRGGYYTNWEGGIRAPGFVNGGFLPLAARGTKRSGATSYIHLADWWCTFAKLAGGDCSDEAGDASGLPAPGTECLGGSLAMYKCNLPPLSFKHRVRNALAIYARCTLVQP